MMASQRTNCVIKVTCILFIDLYYTITLPINTLTVGLVKLQHLEMTAVKEKASGLITP